MRDDLYSTPAAISNEVFLGRQPILDSGSNIRGYELLFRSGVSLHANVVDDLAATAAVIVNTLSNFGLEQVVGEHDAYINVSASLLMSELIELLPAERIVLEILEDVPVNTDIVERCRHLKQRGFRLALDDFIYRSDYDALLPMIDIVKIDITQQPASLIARTMKVIRHKSNACIVAEKVETETDFHTCLQLGFDLFQGYYYARPVVMQGRKPKQQQRSLMRLLGLLISNAELHAIEEVFKHDASLTVSFLKLVNSVGVNTTGQKISSMRQALLMIGQKQLSRWIQLLLYVAQDAPGHGSLMMQVANRARMMELLADKLQSEERYLTDQAFMVGMLSMIDALFRAPLPDILDEIGIDEKLRLALLARQGQLGDLLDLAEKLETGDFPSTNDKLLALNISIGDFNEAQLQAIGWAHNLLKQQQF